MNVLSYLRMVLWAFFGIRRRARAADELQRARPLALVLTALALAALFVAIVLQVATWAAGAGA